MAVQQRRERHAFSASLRNTPASACESCVVLFAETRFFCNWCPTLCRHEWGIQPQVFLVAVAPLHAAHELLSFARLELGVLAITLFINSTDCRAELCQRDEDKLLILQKCNKICFFNYSFVSLLYTALFQGINFDALLEIVISRIAIMVQPNRRNTGYP